MVMVETLRPRPSVDVLTVALVHFSGSTSSLCYAAAARADLGDRLTNNKGSGIRGPGRL